MKARNPGSTVKVENSVFDLLMTSKLKFCFLWLYAYQTKGRNPGNTVKAENSLFDLLMTSNDLQIDLIRRSKTEFFAFTILHGFHAFVLCAKTKV